MWTPAGERALLRTFDDPDLASASARARALAATVGARGEFEDVVLGARSVLVVLRAGADVAPSALPAEGDPTTDAGGRTHVIDVDYDGEDLRDVAAHAGISPDDVVRLHAEADYIVAFLGFSPGFAYLLGLPTALRVPRLATPRTRVPAGSVAITGAYAAVYPAATPGGWRLIGRTDARLFDPVAEPPARLRPGDAVRFVAR